MGRAVAQTAEIRTPRSWPESGLVDARRGYNTAVADEAQSHAQLQGVLTELRRQSAAQGVLLLSGDGAVLHSVGDIHADLDALAAYAASAVMVGERLGESAAFGAPEAVMVVYGGRAVVMAPLGPVVAVVIGAASQLGVLRLALARYLDDLNAALRGELASGHQGSDPAFSGGDGSPDDGDESLTGEDLSSIRINPGLV